MIIRPKSLHLDHSAVTIGDDYCPGELIERPHGNGGLPTQPAKLGMQPGRGAKRIEQLSKRCDCRRRKRLLIHSPMNAENNGASGVIEASGSYYVADTGLAA